MEKDKIKSKTEELMGLLGFLDVVIEVDHKDEGASVQLSVLPEHSGIMIGRHGEGVDAIQTIISSMCNNQKEEWTRISVNINDYREQREETIKTMVIRAAENAKSTSKEIVLNFLPSHERRLAHMHLADDDGVQTYSEGHGKNRRLVISPILEHSSPIDSELE